MEYHAGFLFFEIPLEKSHLKRIVSETSLVVQWLRLRAFLQGVWVRFLVWELRSHMPCSVANKYIKWKEDRLTFPRLPFYLHREAWITTLGKPCLLWTSVSSFLKME